MAGKTFGIDFGTRTIKIYKKGEGVIYDEKNVIAIENKKNVKAVGDDAFEMLEKAPANITVSYPVRSGVIADIKKMEVMFNTVLKKISKGRKIGNADFIIAIPTDITEVEKRAFFDLVVNSSAKAKNIKIVDKPIADAVGIGLDVNNASGVMTVNIGADTTEISIMSLGGIVLSKLIPVGGNKLDEVIQLNVKKKYNLVIGDKTAETIKKELASAYPSEEKSVKVYGRNVVTGLPTENQIKSDMVYESIKEHLHTIIDAIRVILERTPPEISSDIIDSGIYVCGGSANIEHLVELIHNETDLKINICNNAANTVVDGLGRIIEEPELSGLAFSLKPSNYSAKMRG